MLARPTISGHLCRLQYPSYLASSTGLGPCQASVPRRRPGGSQGPSVLRPGGGADPDSQVHPSAGPTRGGGGGVGDLPTDSRGTGPPGLPARRRGRRPRVPSRPRGRHRHRPRPPRQALPGRGRVLVRRRVPGRGRLSARGRPPKRLGDPRCPHPRHHRPPGRGRGPTWGRRPGLGRRRGRCRVGRSGEAPRDEAGRGLPRGGRHRCHPRLPRCPDRTSRPGALHGVARGHGHHERPRGQPGDGRHPLHRRHQGQPRGEPASSSRRRLPPRPWWAWPPRR